MSEFSVLLPVYWGDDPAHFERALRSIGAEQTLTPAQIVVVCDGPVQGEIDDLLIRAGTGATPELTGGAPVSVVRLEHNVGLGPALNEGLSACEYDIVARADSDDISLPHRFEDQLAHMDWGCDIVGCSVAEFEDDEHHIGMVRRMPRTSGDVRTAIGFRDPFNHPTVVYRASAVEAVGGYEDLPHMEDYWLFSRMIAAGQRGCNLDDALVLYRVGAGAYQRRGGTVMLRSELDLQRRMHGLGLISSTELIRNVLVRGGYRLMPTAVRRTAYRLVGARRWFRA